MNSGKEVAYSRKKKKSEDLTSTSNDNDLTKRDSGINERFLKHINKFCTTYQDFDVYETDHLSALV
jgi:hypothetical protein